VVVEPELTAEQLVAEREMRERKRRLIDEDAHPGGSVFVPAGAARTQTTTTNRSA
jgi:hypothetical protein